MTSRREHYLEAERMIATVLEGSAAVAEKVVTADQAMRIQSTFSAQIALAQVHATLATVPARWIAGETYADERDYLETIGAVHPDVNPEGDTRGTGMGILHPRQEPGVQ